MAIATLQDLQDVLGNLAASLARYSSVSRLYELKLQNQDLALGVSGLLVEGFAAQEEINGIGSRDIIVLSTSAHIELKSLLGQSASLQSSLSDGSRASFTGLIHEAAMLGSEGGFARYRVRLAPWPWLLTQCRTSRVWQDKSVVAILENVFASYSAHAAWGWSEDVAAFMDAAKERSYCVQYRESDYDFVTRLLREEGLNWRVEEDDAAPCGHRIVLFADSTQEQATPEDQSSAHVLGGSGIRFHGGRAREEQDSIQTWGAKRTLHSALTTLLTSDYKSKQAIAASAPTHHDYGGKNAPVLESYDVPGSYAYANAAQAQRYAQLQMEATEARNKLWLAHSTVRSLRPGTRFSLSQGPLQQLGDTAPSYVVLNVSSAGINNLPKPAQQALAELFGPIPELLASCLPPETAPETTQRSQQSQNQPMLEQAIKLGYANSFTAIRADIPWRPQNEEHGARHNARPTALGSQTAIVVGANGQACPNGADEIYSDRLGRVRLRFHWQGQHDDANATCWVRVAQRAAGGGMGVQFLPRIGQEVLVQFIEGDIDRPLIIAALYNGQGEGGTLPTPGGKADAQANLTVYEAANDHSVSAQGNLAGGNSPVWHGASNDQPGHRNASAQWGIRSKEFGGSGYNQLVFDDTDQQGRIQLKTTQAATELNLGHLIHSADNYRGSFRGLGAELRTDAYGAIRAAAGILITSYKGEHGAATRDYAGDNVAGMALMKQATVLAKSFSDAAKTHQTVAYASHLGSSKADTSQIDPKAAPLKALHTAVSGMLSQDSSAAAKSDAAAKSTAASADKLPHSTDPIIAISAKGGLGMTAGQDLQMANGETVTLMSGLDSQFITANQWRVQTGQAIGMLAGAVKPGENGIGLQLIAAKDAIDIQAQSDTIQIQAREEIDILSAHAHIDWAAAKSISLSTAGGANITIEGGNITVQCPGKILIQAGKKSFLAPEKTNYKLPILPQSICIECLKKRAAQRSGLINRGA
ncbi:type VI secretion system Vgr family protein [Undibacterium sp. Ren11W]|uniref:type VI secretion system Vgr family protein n=1 Tax=Undibacterium sp. Ren11W TaxID=3413045 RepID=UPI003BF2F93F